MKLTKPHFLLGLIFLLGCSSIRAHFDIGGALAGIQGIVPGMTQEQVLKKSKGLYKEFEIVERNPERIVLTETYQIRRFHFQNGRFSHYEGEFVDGFLLRKVFEEEVANGGQIVAELLGEGLLKEVSWKLYITNKRRLAEYMMQYHPELKFAVMHIVDQATAY